MSTMGLRPRLEVTNGESDPFISKVKEFEDAAIEVLKTATTDTSQSLDRLKELCNHGYYQRHLLEKAFELSGDDRQFGEVLAGLKRRQDLFLVNDQDPTRQIFKGGLPWTYGCWYYVSELCVKVREDEGVERIDGLIGHVERKIKFVLASPTPGVEAMAHFVKLLYQFCVSNTVKTSAKLSTASAGALKMSIEISDGEAGVLHSVRDATITLSCVWPQTSIREGYWGRVMAEGNRLCISWLKLPQVPLFDAYYYMIDFKEK